MKRQYIAPETEVMKIATVGMLAASDPTEKVEETNPEVITNPGTFADGKEGGFSFWGDSAEEE